MRWLSVVLAGAALPGCRVQPIPPPEPVAEASNPYLEGTVDLRGETWVTPWEVVGRSVSGRPIRARTVGSGPRRVLWIGAIHGNEQEARVATASLPADFLAVPGLHRRVTLTVVEDVNPDGAAAGRRENSRGVDLNRNFPARNFGGPTGGSEPLSEPESRALKALIERLEPHLVIVCHSWRGRHFVNYDGPAEQLAGTFSRLSGYPVVESSSFRATPGSLGSWVGVDQRIPILTLEYRNGKDPWLAWEETRAAALAVIEGT